MTSFFKPTAEQSDGGHAENDQDSSSSSSNIYDDGEDENENDGPTMHETDSLLAQTLNKLSMRERDEALQDLHGVADTQSETPGFVEKSLKDFNEELEKVKSKKAYYMAKSISLNYVSNKKIRLQFLRAENYNAKNAANRMVMFFESKLEIFGKTRLTQDIRLSDFSKEDLANFEKGYLHLLPQKDRAGRTIICTIGVMAATIPVETRVRTILGIIRSPFLEVKMF